MLCFFNDLESLGLLQQINLSRNISTLIAQSFDWISHLKHEPNKEIRALKTLLSNHHVILSQSLFFEIDSSVQAIVFQASYEDLFQFSAYHIRERLGQRSFLRFSIADQKRAIRAAVDKSVTEKANYQKTNKQTLLASIASAPACPTRA